MKRIPAALILVVCLVGLTYGVIELLTLRFETGDVYPAYSSLRSDPAGTMALYESLASLDGVSVQRDMSASNELPAAANTTYLHLAASVDAWSELPPDLADKLERFVNS